MSTSPMRAAVISRANNFCSRRDRLLNVILSAGIDGN